MRNKTIESKPLRKQMYIILGSCWKCKESMNIALIDGNAEIQQGSVYGPESFSDTEIKLAESNNVIIKMQHSGTMHDDYLANTCPHCGTFSGQFYHSEIFDDARHGYYLYNSIDLD